ncbi:hypothetical protein EHS25_000634 [Saitozyma podzolica]|uniref:Uncharacterized protein n=1 Tax=Saitozyma podzolica TaxID=1890683 RepID=A0A427YWR3_9TREE|nr:hypothetical protein EHS25_000634 [Saitozyma podzolica]
MIASNESSGERVARDPSLEDEAGSVIRDVRSVGHSLRMSARVALDWGWIVSGHRSKDVQSEEGGQRGVILSLLIFGLVIAYWAAYGLLQKYTTDFTWRMMFSLQLIAVTIMAVMLGFMPESP